MGLPISNNYVPSIKPGSSTHAMQAPAAPGFDQVFDQIKKTVEQKDLFGTRLHGEITTLQARLQGGKGINAAELLTYQMKAQELGLRIELVSKVAESVLSTFRKLQHNQ